MYSGINHLDVKLYQRQKLIAVNISKNLIQPKVSTVNP